VTLSPLFEIKNSQYFKGVYCILLTMLHENSWFSVLLHHIIWWLDTNILEDYASSIFRVEVPAAWSFDTLLSNHHITWCSSPENHEFYLHCH